MTDPRKPVFDAVRDAAQKGLFNDPMNILALDNLLDAFGVPRPAASNGERKTSGKGIELIHSFEGYAKALPNGDAQAYPDPGTGGAPWTIGWGSTTDEQGKPIARGTVWTRARADARFAQHLAQFERELNAALGNAPTTQNQFDALVSFAYNVGSKAAAGSTLMRKHKAADYAGAQAEFFKWRKASGKVMTGLVRRREAEAALYGS